MSNGFKCKVITKKEFFELNPPIEESRQHRVEAFKSGQCKTVIAVTFPGTPVNEAKINDMKGLIFTDEDNMPILRPNSGKPETLEKMELATISAGKTSTAYFKGDSRVIDMLAVQDIIDLPKSEQLKKSLTSKSVTPKPLPGPSYEKDSAPFHVYRR